MAYWLFSQLYALDIGKNKVLGRPFTFLPELTVIIIGLKYFGFLNPTKYQVAIFLTLGIFSAWLVGKVYMRLNLDRIENMISTERNPQIQELYEVHCNGRDKG